VGLFIALAGGLGLLFAIGAVIEAGRRSRPAVALGMAAVAFGVACALLGGAGVVVGRARADVRTPRDAEQSEYAFERLRREGYRAARGAAKLGLICGAIPMLAGLGVVLGARRRRDPEVDDDLAALLRPRRAPRIAAVSASVLGTGFALAAWSAPLPGHDITFRDPGWLFRDHIAAIARAETTRELTPLCGNLEMELETSPGSLPPPLPAELRPAARKCVEDRIQQAAVLSTLGEVDRRLLDLWTSPFVQRDAELRRHVEATIAEVREMRESERSARAIVTDVDRGP
jgi:hypothetical protein